MSRYICKLIDKDGRSREIAREGASESKIKELYSGGDLFLVSIRESKGEIPKARKAFKREDVRELTIMLSALLGSGLVLKEALAIAAEISPRGKGGRSLSGELLEAIGKGDSFSKALEACGDSFSEFYRGMIRIGERVGSTDRVLARLAAYLNDRKALREKAGGALAYPVMVCALALLGSAGIIAFLVPRLLEIFSGLGGEAARRVRDCAEAMTAAFRLLGIGIGGILAAALAAVRLRKGDEGIALALDVLALRLPLLGAFLTAYESLSFAYAMETLSGGGVSVEAGLAEAAKVLGNRSFRSAVSRCLDELLKGGALSAAVARRSELPRLMARWVAVGERTGRAEEAFGQLRRYYQGEVDRITSRFMTLVEPALILVVGCMTAVLALVFILPLFSMYGAML